MHPSGCHDIFVNIHGDNRAAGPNDASHQGGVVSSARTNLQYALSRLQAELFEHDCHDRRL
jgi:hypothetical protein